MLFSLGRRAPPHTHTHTQHFGTIQIFHRSDCGTVSSEIRLFACSVLFVCCLQYVFIKFFLLSRSGPVMVLLRAIAASSHMYCSVQSQRQYTIGPFSLCAVRIMFSISLLIFRSELFVRRSESAVAN